MAKASRKTPRAAPAHAHHESPSPRLPWHRRISWWAVAITLAVIVSAAFAADPIRDAVSGAAVGEARLEVSPGYILLAPLSAILDTVTLLTIPQHIAVLLWVIGVYVVWRLLASSTKPDPRREINGAAILLGAIVLTYAAAAYLPRPMASLTVSDETVLAVDFHSHTEASHDGRKGWTDDDVRAWHRDAGYDVAYITDHRSFTGAERGIASNPAVAGQGTLILQGIEAVFRGEHVVILNAGRRYKGILTADMGDVDEQALQLASIIPPTTPVLIETIPGNLDKVPAASPELGGGGGVQAIEVVDGSPRGLTEGRRDRERIDSLIDKQNLAPVSGSDNHGYGRAAPAWTLLRIPGWRGMPGDSLSRRIEEVLRNGRKDATRVAERRIAGSTTPTSIALAGPAVAWRMLTTLSADERVMWIAWTWAIVLIAAAVRRRRRKRAATPHPPPAPAGA
ncbi:MAG TPA: hypothetical protein VGQ44_04825 [Gemmatimonadaceae bacterium]|jgi:hypothetical protein|nr:hypothetical protein [Gemmatimonadaceae bacterium]